VVVSAKKSQRIKTAAMLSLTNRGSLWAATVVVEIKMDPLRVPSVVL
jgi:hypothetical protein